MSTCGTTHYLGCECHEAGWEKRLNQEREEILNLKADLAASQAENARLSAELGKHYDAPLCDRLADQPARAQSEAKEQARLLGMSGSREAKLLAQVEQLKADLARTRDALSTVMTEAPSVYMPVVAHALDCHGKGDV